MDSTTAPYFDDYPSTLIPSDLFESDRSSTLDSNHISNVPSNHSSLEIPSPPSELDNASVFSVAYPASINSAHAGSTPGNLALKSTASPPSRFGNTTRRYGHLPYEDFKERVQALWKSLEPLQLWRNRSKRKSFFDSRLGRFFRSNKVLGRAFRRWNLEPPECKTEQIRGGSYNRVIGLTIPETYKTPSSIDRDFILRIPRDDDARLDRDVAVLEYVRNSSTIPVPEIVHKDFTTDNPLGFPYMIQKRIHGRPLVAIWENLNVEQRCSVASDMAETLRKLQSVTGLHPGIIEAREEVSKGHLQTFTVPYDLRGSKGVMEGPEMSSPYPSKHASTLDLIVYQINRWRGLELAIPEEPRARRWGLMLACWDRIHQAAVEMDLMGLLKDTTYSLCHLDLQLRNIMGEIQDDKTVKITGYLDWDSAVIAPSFVGCAPPFYLWHDGDSPLDEEDERGATCEPMEAINIKVKQIFDDAVGREYLHYAYEPRFRLARMLFRIVKEGIWEPDRARQAVNFVDDWCDLRKLMLPEAVVARLY